MALRPKIEPKDHSAHCSGYLEKMLMSVLEGDRKKAIKNGPHSLRTFQDSWYAYHRGGCFLNKRGYVQWFKRGQLAHPRHRKTMQDNDFISAEAWDVLHGRANGVHLVKDHAVPVCVLYDELVALKHQKRSPM
jgi:hypothetical protein